MATRISSARGDDHSGITFLVKLTTNGRYVSFSTTPDNGNTRLDPADMLTLLNATNLTSPTSIQTVFAM